EAPVSAYREPIPVYPNPESPLTLAETQAKLKAANENMIAAKTNWDNYGKEPALATYALLGLVMAQNEVNFWAMAVRMRRIEDKVDVLLDRTDPNPQDRP